MAADAALKSHFRGEIREISRAFAPGPPQADDINLSEMARNALNYLRGNPDPARAYECKFSLGPLGIPCHYPEIAPPDEYGYDPVSLGDTDCRMDWQYAHMREMAGEPEADAVEKGVRARIRSYQKEDRLVWVNPVAYIGQPISGTWATTWSSAKLMQSLAESYEREGNAEDIEEARAIFRALKAITLWDGDRAYYPGIAPYRDGQWLKIGWCADHGRNYPFIVEPCVRLWEVSGDEEALDFARAVAEGFLSGVQPDQREMKIDPETGAFQGHVHLHTHAVWGVAHLGAVLSESRYLDWAGRAYEFVRASGADYGWYPEFIPQSEYRSEICVVGDMVSTGVWLARGGMPHCWDHVERTVVNMLSQSQFFLTPGFLALFHRIHQGRPSEEIESAIRELRKLEGGFAAQPAFDDWVSYPDKMGEPGTSANGLQMMGCCPPEGMRGLWEAWQGALEERREGVYINMALTRSHRAAKVTAYQPACGRLDIEARRPGDYFLRPPAWADRTSAKLLRNGQNEALRWCGPAEAYVKCPALLPGDMLTVTWPVPAFAQTFVPTSVPGRQQPVTVRWTGNRVTGVEPQGSYLPMFSDDHGR
ncbi:MAG: hypothetical protein IT210_11150 [Armatimonadetes bacterium]|nr:hypothetical protein [Armatimonadota bacterium]